MKTFGILFTVLQCAIMTKGEDTTVVNLSEELAALNKSERQELNVQGKEKPILRYGFHKTDLCIDYERAFLCVRKCLDFGFDVAYADKRCKCTCYRKKDKAKYTPAGKKNQTNYLLGTPTTKLPAWAQPPTPEPLETPNEKDSQEKSSQEKSSQESQKKNNQNNLTEGNDTNDGDDYNNGPETNETESGENKENSTDGGGEEEEKGEGGSGEKEGEREEE